MLIKFLKFLGIKSDSGTSKASEENLYKNAINCAVPSIEFSPDGEVISANQLFLDLMGYHLHEVMGKEHTIFCDECAVESIGYIEFWNDLRKGVAQRGVFVWVKRNGEIIWLEGTYIPVLNEHGGVSSIIKLAFEITEKQKELDRYKRMLRAQQLNNLSD